MKTLYTIIVLLLACTLAFAQTPEAFKYQAVIGHGDGAIIANTTVALRVSVLQGSQNGAAVYEETFHPTTNPHGLVDLELGNGSFHSIDWGAHTYFLKIEVDPANGTNFTHLGTSQLLSVPYAMIAHSAEVDMVEDGDPDPNNELQTISLAGSELTLSEGGGTVILPSGGSADNWGAQVVESDATLSGVGTSGDPLGVVGDLTDDQTLSLAGNDLTILDGNTVTLPSTGGADNWGAQVVESDATLSGDGTSGDPLGVVGDLTDDQTLSLVGNDLTILDGNTVTLPSTGGADNWGAQVVESDATLSGDGTSGDPLAVVGDLTDNQTLSLVGNDLTIADGNTVGLPSSPWLYNASNIYFNGGNVGINNSSPTFDFHVNGNSMFDTGLGTIQIATPGSYPGLIAFDITSDHRRDIAFRPGGVAITASTSNSGPGLNDGIWISEGGNLGIQTGSTGPYPLMINERSEYGLAISRAAGGGLWEIFTSYNGGLYLYRANSELRGVFDGTSGVYTPVSDRSFKKNIRPLNSSLDNVTRIRPSSYEMKAGTNGRREIGLIAQELKKHFPELVYEINDEKSGKTLHTVNYNGIAVVAVKAIQEQQEIIEAQDETIEQLTERIEDLERKFESLQRSMRQLR